MTGQAPPLARLRHAIQAGSVTLALATAAELPHPLDLADALALTVLFARREPGRYGRAAARFAGRYLVERPRVELAEAELLLSLLGALPHRPTAAARGLEALFSERNDPALAEVVRRSVVEAQRRR